MEAIEGVGMKYEDEKGQIGYKTTETRPRTSGHGLDPSRHSQDTPGHVSKLLGRVGGHWRVLGHVTNYLARKRTSFDLLTP